MSSLDGLIAKSIITCSGIFLDLLKTILTALGNFEVFVYIIFIETFMLSVNGFIFACKYTSST